MHPSALGGSFPATEHRPQASAGSAASAANPAARPAAALPPGQTVPQPAPAAELSAAVERLQSAAQSMARNLLFSVDEDTGKTVVKVIDSNTDEVIRQIPSEEFIALSKSLGQLQGLLLRQEA